MHNGLRAEAHPRYRMLTGSTTRKRAAERDSDCETVHEYYDSCGKRQRAETAVDQVCEHAVTGKFVLLVHTRLALCVSSADAYRDSGYDS